jgi:hypothetical protein
MYGPSHDLPLPPPPPPSALLPTTEPEVGIPFVKAALPLPKQSPAFNRLQPYVANSMPRPFVPNQSNNSWRPVNMTPITAHKPPEPLNQFRSTDIDVAPAPVPVVKDKNADQLRQQLSRLLVDRQKHIQSTNPPSSIGSTATAAPIDKTSVINAQRSAPPTQSTYQCSSSSAPHSLHVPTSSASKSLSARHSGSISPLGSIGSIGSAGSFGSISPQSSASGARMHSNESARRRPSPLYQNSNEADVDYLTDLLVQGLNGRGPSSDPRASSAPTSSANSSATPIRKSFKANIHNHHSFLPFPRRAQDFTFRMFGRGTIVGDSNHVRCFLNHGHRLLSSHLLSSPLISPAPPYFFCSCVLNCRVFQQSRLMLP